MIGYTFDVRKVVILVKMSVVLPNKFPVRKDNLLFPSTRKENVELPGLAHHRHGSAIMRWDDYFV